MPQEIMMTAEGYEDLKKELQELKTVKVGQIAEKLKIARGFGDLSENSEYDEAKNEQAIVMARIMTIEEQLSKVKIVNPEQAAGDTVTLGSRVRVYDIDMDEEQEYRIISPVESTTAPDAITNNSPMGEALVGHKAGETVDVHAPAGVYQIKILSINA